MATLKQPKQPKNNSNQTPQLLPNGPTIEYVGEGAEDIQFTINPDAKRYVVRSTGLIMEYL